MNAPLSRFSFATLAATAAVLGVAQAGQAAILIDFNNVTGVGSKTRTQAANGGAATGSLTDFDTGITGEGGFAGNFGSNSAAITATASGTTTGGVGGTGAIQLVLNVDETSGSPNNVFAGISQQASSTMFTTTDPNQLEFLVDVNAPLGVQFSIRAETTANNLNKARSVTFTGTGEFTTFGGLLSTFNQGATSQAFFDSFAANPSQTLTFIVSDSETATGRATLAADPTFVVDNIRLQAIPEPTSIVAGLFGLGGLLLRRRATA